MKKKIKKAYRKYIDNYKKSHKSIILIILFVVSSFLNALILNMYTIHSYDLKAIILDITVLSLLGSFAFLIRPKRRIMYLMILSLITTGICVLNSIYYTFYQSYASVSLLATSTQVVDVGDAVIQTVLQLKDFTFLWQPIFLYYIHTRLIKKNYYVNNYLEQKKSLFTQTITTSIFLIMITCLFVTPTEWGRFGKLWNREFVVDEFGIYAYHVNDLVQSLRPKLSTLFGYDNAVKTVSDYYKENPYVQKNNEYTDIFKDKNLIIIHAESIETLTMELEFNGQVVTPNLRKLASEGIFFNNFYAQVGVGNSSDSEFTLNSSLMPSNNGTVFVSYFNREYITMPKLLKEKGYYTFSMHGNNGEFWNRKTMHKNMGYDKFYDKEYFNIDETIGFNGKTLSDKSFFRQAVPMIKKEVENGNFPYYATMIMVSNHTPFDDQDLMDPFPVDYKIETSNGIISRPYMEGTLLGRYFRSVHYADQAIGQFINDLDKEGLLENTVIVIYGDHDIKMPKNEYNLLYNYDSAKNRVLQRGEPGYKELFPLQYQIDKRVPFIIWTKDKEFNLEINKVGGMIDILPTLGNMFGFHSEYQLGNDLFNAGDNMVVFTEGNFITDKIYYDSQKGIMYPITNDPIDKNYIDKRAEKAEKIIEVSNNIISYDLIKKLKEKSK